VVFFEKPFRKLDRILMMTLQTYPQSYKVFRESMIAWMTDKLWVVRPCRPKLGCPRENLVLGASPFARRQRLFVLTFDEAAILTVDGVGDGDRHLRCGPRNDIKLQKQMEFPHSLGLLYSAFTAFLGFEVNEGEYKVMGMAPYGVRAMSTKCGR